MVEKNLERTTVYLTTLGATLTTLFLLTNSVTDPVNATKLFIVGGLGVGLLSLFLVFNFGINIQRFSLLVTFISVFLLASVNSALNSSSPITQNLYGAYGRNTGLVAYVALASVTLGVLNLREVSSFKWIIGGLQAAGLVNVVYCGWVLSFGEIIPWSNPYKKILGTFGNPDFISAFLGIFLTTVFAITLAKTTSWRYRIGAIFISVLTIYEIVASHAIQGIVVTLGGFVLVLYFKVRSHFRSKLVAWSYLALAGIFGVLAIFGTLQKGPFAFVYKGSVSLRGAYWRAGIQMGELNPFTGVGMDSYGDWYRRARSLNAATALPGPKVITNAAHNVIIDFFAYGGWPLLLGYVGMLTVASLSIVKVMRRSSDYDPIFVAMVSAWACYQVQSIISINQIGLAIWGWLLTGAIVSFELVTRTQPIDKSSTTKNSTKFRVDSVGTIFSPKLVAGLGVILGLLTAVPPLSADTRWRSATKSLNADSVIQSLQPGYLNPSDSQRYAQAVQLFVNSNLMSQAHKIAIQATEFNPDYFDAWAQLYAIPNSSPTEKATALRNMKRLDPLNPDVTAK